MFSSPAILIDWIHKSRNNMAYKIFSYRLNIFSIFWGIQGVIFTGLIILLGILSILGHIPIQNFIKPEIFFKYKLCEYYF